jgi:diphosphomevalonate decarboxylase
MNLHGLHTETSLTWSETITSDYLTLNDKNASDNALSRVSNYLNTLRERYGITGFAQITSNNNFPTGAGIASSASAFAALALAATRAAGLTLNKRELSTVARLGSGSASRSIPGGFVEWHAGDSHETSYAESFAQPTHWQLVDVIAIVSTVHKSVGSTQGHQLAPTSDLQPGRLAHVKQRLAQCKQAILDRDFATFAEVVEQDSNMMHAVMMTSNPPLFYWQPASIQVMQLVRRWRSEGLKVCYTLDAGPNVHCLCAVEDAPEVQVRLQQIIDVSDVKMAGVGDAAHIVNS